MAKPKDIKIIKEIKSKINVIEKEEEEIEKTEETTEESLEDIAFDAPSAREFPEFSMLGEQGSQGTEQRQDIIQTPSATTEEENKNPVRYQVQGDISEGEIARIYRTEVSEARPIMLSIDRSDRTSREISTNREVESLRTQDAEIKYRLPSGPEKPIKKRKYPWES